MRNNKWRKFQRLADAIKNAEELGALVRWNTRIEGQRFDAAIQSSYKDATYLIVVECVDDAGPVTAARIKGFAKKVEAAGAHTGIMASSSDFLEDAFELTAELPVIPLGSHLANEMSDERLVELFFLILLAYDFRFTVAGSSEIILIPQEPALLRFLMRELQIRGPGIDTFPEHLTNEATSKLKYSASSKTQNHEIPFPKGTLLIDPNMKTKTPVSAFVFSYRLIPYAELKIPKEINSNDPYFVEASLKEELAKRNPMADPSKIETGFDTVLRPKRYYYNPRLQFSYYCEEVKKGEAKIVLVESYQNEGLLQARFTITKELYKQFVEITDEAEKDRLTKIYDSFSVSDKNLEGRFEVFLRDLEGVEFIDKLALTLEQRKANKADYFFNNREIICEQKALYDDMIHKVEEILTPYREKPEWPLFFGKQDLQKVLRHLPDREQITSKIVNAVTKSIERIVEDANRQIRATKETFGLQNSGGLLVILNDAVDILSPELVTWRVRKALNKRVTAGGELRYPHVSAVLLVGGAHYTQLTQTLKGIPLLIMTNAVPEGEKVADFVHDLTKKWSAFDKQPLIQIETDEFPKLSFRTFSEDKKASGPLRRYDFWSAQYSKNPYLRQLNEEELLEFGKTAFEEVMKRIVKGAPKMTKSDMEKISIPWSNFLDEVKHRAIDLKKFTAKLGDVDKKMEELYQHYKKQQDSEPE